VIVLPDGVSLDKPLPAVGFRPDDPPAGPNDAGMKMLASLGGTTARAASDGRFALVIPKPGLYHLLIISRNRSGKQDEALDRQDLKELGNFFEPTNEVLKDRRWKWIPRKVQPGMQPVNVDFLALE
jgi:hypothetical protein